MRQTRSLAECGSIGAESLPCAWPKGLSCAKSKGYSSCAIRHEQLNIRRKQPINLNLSLDLGAVCLLKRATITIVDLLDARSLP